MGDGWRRWFVRDGRLRALWRALLFIALLVAVLWTEVLVLAALGSLPAQEEGLSAGLVLQGGLLLIAAVVAGLAMLRWVDRRPAAELGLTPRTGAALELAAGLGIGAGVMVVVVLSLTAFGAVRYVTEPGSWADWLRVSAVSLAALAIPAAAEEAVFRGYLFRTLVQGGGAGVAVAATSLLFTVAHGSNPNVTALGLVNIFLAGVLLAVAVLRTRALWLAIGIHLGWNWAMAGPLDLPVSGLGGFDVPFYDVVETAPIWLTGGEFGPEGGVAATAATFGGLALVLWATRRGTALARHNGNGRRDFHDR